MKKTLIDYYIATPPLHITVNLRKCYHYHNLNICVPGSQATVSTRSVAVGDTTYQFRPQQSSTPLKRKAVPPEITPTKRPHLEFSSIQESETSESFVDPDDSTYFPTAESFYTTNEQ